MKKNKLTTILKAMIATIIALIVIPIMILIMPIKHIEMSIDTNYGKRENLDLGTKQIYVHNSLDYPGWAVIGKDGVLFNDSNENIQGVFIYGNFPNKMNNDLLNNTFVLNGKYVGKKEYHGIVAGCFEVESWGVLGKLNRKEDSVFSHTSLTGWDYMMAEETTWLLEKDKLKDVE